MQRFDFFPDDLKVGYLLNVQSELLAHLNTAVVVPLTPTALVKTPIRQLNPVFEIVDKFYILRTQFISAVPKSILKNRVGSLDYAHTEIINALDMLFSGV